MYVLDLYLSLQFSNFTWCWQWKIAVLGADSRINCIEALSRAPKEKLKVPTRIRQAQYHAKHTHWMTIQQRVSGFPGTIRHLNAVQASHDERWKFTTRNATRYTQNEHADRCLPVSSAGARPPLTWVWHQWRGQTSRDLADCLNNGTSCMHIQKSPSETLSDWWQSLCAICNTLSTRKYTTRTSNTNQKCQTRSSQV